MLLPDCYDHFVPGDIGPVKVCDDKPDTQPDEVALERWDDDGGHAP